MCTEQLIEHCSGIFIYSTTDDTIIITDSLYKNIYILYVLIEFSTMINVDLVVLILQSCI